MFAVYLTHLPTRGAVHDADLGAPKQPVTPTTASGLRLRGWYVPSRNGAAVAVMHGTGSNRLGVADHARLLARHGYGVLVFDLPRPTARATAARLSHGPQHRGAREREYERRGERDDGPLVPP